MSHRTRTETLELAIVQCTDKAVQVRDERMRKPVWIPFSQIVEPDERYIRECVGETIEIEIPNWLAENEGLL